MPSTMGCPPDYSIATRESLLRRLSDCDDQASWREFYETYRDLIYRFALKAGCTETEADEVVQETVIGVARRLPEFKYDPAVCSFKTWLLNQTVWRIKDEFRKRPKGRQVSSPSGAGGMAVFPVDETRRTGTLERIADPHSNELEVLWEADWQETVARTAMQRVKEQANLKDCQMFDLYVLRQWPARDVTRALGVSVARVYLAKHRIAPLVKKEIKRLETTLM